MRLATSGSRGVFWRQNARGSQEFTRADGRRPSKDDPRRGQRGDWWIRWACPHGHLHRKPIGPKSLAQAESQRNRLERPCPDRQPKATAFLLADVIDEYLANTKAHKRSYADDARYGKMWKARFPGRTLDEISPAELDKIRTERLATTKGAGPATIAPATVNREYAFLKHVFNVAVRDGKTVTNPVAKLRMLRESSGRVRYLSDDEEERLAKALPSDEDRARLTILLHTGFRRSELLGLRWRDVDFKAGVLTIPKSKNGDARHVPMTSVVRDVLGRRPRPLDSTVLVFPNSEGNPDFRWAMRTFPAAVRAAGIEAFRLHDTRHTFASRLAMEGVELLTIKALGGWKSLPMVARYAHLSPEHGRAAIERLAVRRRVVETSIARAE